jgi:hypothetical protein
MQQALLFEASDPIALVQQNPTLLVSVLRIVEREEKSALHSFAVGLDTGAFILVHLGIGLKAQRANQCAGGSCDRS